MTQPADKYPFPGQILPLTAVRFWAASWVMIFHFSTMLPDGSIKDWPWVLRGYLGVDFFFILSGFVLAHAYRPSPERTKKIDALRFYQRRLARIYPLHLLTLFLYFAAGSYLALHTPGILEKAELYKYRDDFSLSVFLSHIMLLHGWGGANDLHLNTPSWSISAEWFAYLLFPFLLLPALHIRKYLILPAALFVLACFWVLIPLAGLGSMTNLTYDYSILRIAPEFLLGVALYTFGLNFTCRKFSRFLALLSCLILYFILQSRQTDDIWIVLNFAAIIFFAADTARHYNNTLFHRKPFSYLGEISYAIYMIHFVIMDFVYVFIAVIKYNNHMPADLFMLTWLSMFPATFACAALLNRFFERPLREFFSESRISRRGCQL